mgnify:CR=1 FL=1
MGCCSLYLVIGMGSSIKRNALMRVYESDSYESQGGGLVDCTG